MRVYAYLVYLITSVTIATCNLACSVNIFTTFANKQTNAALYEDAQSAIDAADYSTALAYIGKMTGAYPSTTPVLQLKASAYAGLCGLQFLPFVQALSGMGSTRLFPFLLSSFDNASSTAMDNCLNAQNTLTSIGDITVRGNDNNFFLAVVAFAKLGNILSYYADPTKTGGATAGFDPCVVGATRTAGGGITDADAREIGTALTLAAANLSVVAGSVVAGSSSLTAITSVCSALPAGYNFCTVTDPTQFTALELLGIRSFIKESSAIGLGSNCTGDVTACFCP